MKKISIAAVLILNSFLVFSQTKIKKDKISICNKTSDTISVHLFDSCRELIDSDGGIVKSFNVDFLKGGDIFSNKQAGNKIDFNTVSSLSKLKPARIMISEIIFVKNKVETKMEGFVEYYIRY